MNPLFKPIADLFARDETFVRVELLKHHDQIDLVFHQIVDSFPEKVSAEEKQLLKEVVPILEETGGFEETVVALKALGKKLEGEKAVPIDELLSMVKEGKGLEVIGKLKAYLKSYDPKEHERLLLQAVLSKDIPLVKFLLGKKVSPNVSTHDGETALHLACRINNIEIARALVDAGADINASNLFKKETPLHKACNAGDLDLVEYLLDHGADPLLQASGSRTSLYYACMGGNLRIVELLLKRGVDPTIETDKDIAEYSIAFRALKATAPGDPEVLNRIVELVEKRPSSKDDPTSEKKYNALKALEELGATRWAPTAHEIRALIKEKNQSVLYALLKKHWDSFTEENKNMLLQESIKADHTEAILFLLRQGVDPNFVMQDGNTALHIACREGNNIDLIKMLVHKSDINAQNKRGYTPLMIAYLHGHKDIVEYLLDAGHVNLALEDDSKMNLFHYAHRNDPPDEKMIQIFLNHPTVEKANRNGYRILLKMKEGKFDEALEIMKKEPFNPNVGDLEGNTLLHLAVKARNRKVAHFLLEQGASYTILNRNLSESAIAQAYKNGDEAMLELFFTYGADPNAKDILGITLLQMAFKNKNPHMALFLLEHGAKIEQIQFPYHQACEMGDLDLVNALIVREVDLQARNFENEPPLYFACKFGNEQIVKALIKAGAKVNEGELHIACIMGDLPIVKELIKNGAKLQLVDSNGLTPLHTACITGKESIVEALLEAGANPNVLDDDGKTPLLYACERENLSIVKKLLDKRANFNATDVNGKTPLLFVCELGNVDIAKALIKAGAKINEKDVSGWIPLHYAAVKGKLEFVKAILDEGIGIADLYLACMIGDVAQIESLIEKGAKIDEKDEQGRTPLHWACYSANEQIVEALIKAKAKLDEKDNSGMTPLHWACSAGKGNEQIVEALIKAKAKLDEKDNSGNTPLHIAYQNGNTKLVEALIASGARGDLFLACQIGNLKLFESFTLEGAELNQVDASGRTMLHYVCEKGNEDIAKALIKAGANPNKKDVWGRTPLHYACGGGKAGIVDLLLKNGALVNERDSEGMTPLFFASSNKFVDVVRMLIQNGADIHAKVQNSEAIVYALYPESDRHRELALEFFNAGVDFETTNTPVNFGILSTVFPNWNWEEILKDPDETLARCISNPHEIASYAREGVTDFNPLELCLAFRSNELFLALRSSLEPDEYKRYSRELKRTFPDKTDFLSTRTQYQKPPPPPFKAPPLEFSDSDDKALDAAAGEAIDILKRLYGKINFTDPTKEGYVPPEKILDQGVQVAEGQMGYFFQVFCLKMMDPKKSSYGPEQNMSVQDIKGLRKKLIHVARALEKLQKKLEDPELTEKERDLLLKDLADQLMLLASTGHHCYRAIRRVLDELMERHFGGIRPQTVKEISGSILADWRERILSLITSGDQGGEPTEINHYLESLIGLRGDLLGLDTEGAMPDPFVTIKNGKLENEDFIVERYKNRNAPENIARLLMEEMKSKGSRISTETFLLWLKENVPDGWNEWDERIADIEDMEEEEAFAYLERNYGLSPSDEILELVDITKLGPMKEKEEEIQAKYETTKKQLEAFIEEKMVVIYAKQKEIESIEKEMEQVSDPEERKKLEKQIEVLDSEIREVMKETGPRKQQLMGLDAMQRAEVQSAKIQYVKENKIYPSPIEYLLFLKEKHDPQKIKQELDAAIDDNDRWEILAEYDIYKLIPSPSEVLNEHRERKNYEQIKAEMEGKDVKEQWKILAKYEIQKPKELGPYETLEQYTGAQYASSAYVDNKLRPDRLIHFLVEMGHLERI